ncbi:hypothetical protein [Nocardia sp. NPDC005366]|uniref:hypothetical protein n=1 Tax=Nocardia sp. NPDC005366 TaxID=3156878 RepID=UPI0033B4AC70
MIDRSTPGTTSDSSDEVSEADLAEQSTPVDPDESSDDEQALAEAVDRDRWNANVADIVEQAIEVPPDDEAFELNE